MYPSAAIALDAELIRLRQLAETQAAQWRETRLMSFRAMRAAGMIITGASGPRAAENMGLWEQVAADRDRDA